MNNFKIFLVVPLLLLAASLSGCYSRGAVPVLNKKYPEAATAFISRSRDRIVEEVPRVEVEKVVPVPAMRSEAVPASRAKIVEEVPPPRARIVEETKPKKIKKKNKPTTPLLPKSQPQKTEKDDSGG